MFVTNNANYYFNIPALLLVRCNAASTAKRPSINFETNMGKRYVDSYGFRKKKFVIKFTKTYAPGIVEANLTCALTLYHPSFDMRLKILDIH